jgi:hypothetical protein
MVKCVAVWSFVYSFWNFIITCFSFKFIIILVFLKFHVITSFVFSHFNMYVDTTMSVCHYGVFTSGNLKISVKN